jgi:hypothetical protein
LDFSAAPARAQNFTPFPPQLIFIPKDGKYTGTLVIEGKTLPITGTLEYSNPGTGEIDLKISVDTEGQLITSDTVANATSHRH